MKWCFCSIHTGTGGPPNDATRGGALNYNAAYILYENGIDFARTREPRTARRARSSLLLDLLPSRLRLPVYIRSLSLDPLSHVFGTLTLDSTRDLL
jgi:hypothetical protein